MANVENPPPATRLGVGLALGAGLGAAVGVATDNLAVWLAIGVAVGVAVGAALDARAKQARTPRDSGDGSGAYPVIPADGGGRSKDTSFDGSDGGDGGGGGGD